MPGKNSVRNDTLCLVRGAVIGLFILATPAYSEAPANDFPTLARVEYVHECINRTGGKQTNMYQCVCVVDRIAEAMSYDEFVEASAFARYATLPGERSGLFRDTDEAKQKAKAYKETEASAFRACNLKPTS
jgi:hypothetical protein